MIDLRVMRLRTWFWLLIAALAAVPTWTASAQVATMERGQDAHVQSLVIEDGIVRINGEVVPDRELPEGLDLRGLRVQLQFAGAGTPVVELDGRRYAVVGQRLQPVAEDGTETVRHDVEVFFRDADGFNVTDGASRHHGIELDAGLELTETLSFAGSATWAIHEYAFDRPVSRGSETIVDGARLDTAPEWLWNLRALWTPTSRTGFEAEWIHVGEYFTDAANSASYEGHDLFNLRARLAVSERVEVFGAVRNVFDTRYAERADFAFGSHRYFPGEPRAVSAGIRISR